MDPAASTSTKPLSTYTPQEDSSKYIRTFAKDFAAISGQAADMGTPFQQAPTTPEQTTVTEGGVSLQNFDPSPVNRTDTSPIEHDAEVVDLKQSDSDGIFGGWTKKRTPLPVGMPIMPQTTIAPKATAPMDFAAEDLTPPSAPVSAPVAAETDVDREAILSRLRAKVAAERVVTATAPVVSETPLRTAAPDFASIPEPVLPMPEPRREVPLTARPPVPTSDASSPLHTYSSDFATQIDSSSSSTFSVLAAQSDAGQTPRSTKPRKKTIIPLLAGGAMLVIGIGAVLGAYLLTRQSAVPVVAGVPSLIQFDEGVEVTGAGQELMQSIANVGQGGSVSGNVLVTYTTLATTSGSGVPQSGGTLIRSLGLTAPDILLRNIDDTSTVGVVRAGSESRPFLILKVNSHERTFAGMLAWEPSLMQDLATFYPEYPVATNASGTPTILPPASTSFTDAVVANYDVRVLRDSSGKSLVLYGYRGKDMLIIARDEAAFTALIGRLRASGS